MSAAALRSLVNSAATTLYDAIGVAETAAELDELMRLVWHGYAAGSIVEADATHLSEYIHRQQTLPGLPLPEPNPQRVGRYPRRRVQRSPDKQALYDRRHRLAYSGVMPHHLAARLTIGEMAVMSVVAGEYRRTTRCELTLDEIAARAGVCRRTARRAIHEARDQHLISIEERPIRGKKHRPNLVKITSFEWLKWLLRAKTKRDQASDPIGGHFVSPTNNILTDDSGSGGKNTAAPAASAPPRSGQPSREAIEFSTELANISGYRQANVPKSWRDANPPQIVQVWLNELAGKDRRPVDALRALAMKVIRRKRALSDASAPYSPRYFSAEVRKLIQSRSELQPTRDRPKAFCVGQ